MSPPRPQAHPTRLLARCSALAWQGSIGQSIDNAAYEVQPAATRRINESTRLHTGTFYLSIAARRAPLSAPTFASIGAIIKRDRSFTSLLTAVVREVIVWISVFDLLGVDFVPGASSFRVMRILRVVRLVPLRLSWI